MPEPSSARKPVTAQRKAQQTAEARDVERKQRSFHEAGTIQDRIRQWRTQEVSQAVDPDVLSVRSQPRSEACRTPIRSYSPAAPTDRQNEAQSTPRKASTKWVQSDNKAWVKQRRSTRGQRRETDNVASRQREQAMEIPKHDDPAPPKAYIRTESQRTRDANSSRVEREERRRRRRELRARDNGGKALVDDGIRVYTRSESHLGSEKGEHQSIPARSVHEGEEADSSPQYKSQLSFKHDGPLPDDDDEQAIEANERPQPSKYAQTLGRPPNSSDTIEQPKTRKRALLTKTKSILTGKNEALPTPSNRLPSIEAWLDEQPRMPDPFVDDEPVITPLPTDRPKPLKHRSHRKKVSIEPTIAEVADPNRIWEAITPPQPRNKQTHSPRAEENVSRQETETSTPKRRLFSFEVCDNPSKGEQVAPAAPPLKYAEHQNDTSTRAQRRDARSRRRRKHVEEAAAPLEELALQALDRQDSIQPDRDISPNKHKPQGPEKIAPPHRLKPQHYVVAGPERPPSGELKRKLTTHDDLLSVLSQPRARKSTRSIRSTRTVELPSNETLLREALRTMQEEEPKYTRELKTLVDGVTPVLLQSLLSKADATTAAGLFSENKSDDASFTRPIIDMGVALQRLKNQHQRLPLQEQNIEALLTWAISAHKTYADYLKVWKLGFQGVIVRLAPLDPSQTSEQEMLARDLDGDATDEHGQKVDVAYLQKRPLIRIKRFSKLFVTLREAMPNHEKIVKVADMYAELTERAKQRHSEEQGRLEDDAAANIDSTKARDIRTMAPVEIVEVDKKRKVRARDYFDLSVCHSTGQRLDSRIEIILRDDPQIGGPGGDILICQVEEESKWLLFQPIQLSNVSSRRDQVDSDLVLMVKGVAGIGRSWSELLALRAEDSAAVTEWLHMLGSNPLPTKLTHIPSWHLPSEPQQEPQTVPEVPRYGLNAQALANLPSDVDVPIGEPSVVSSRRPGQHKPLPKAPVHKEAERPLKLSMGGGLQTVTLPEYYRHASHFTQSQSVPAVNNPKHSSVSPNKDSLPMRPHQPPAASIHAPQGSQQRYSPQKVYQPSVLSGTTASEVYAHSNATSNRSSDVSHVAERKAAVEEQRGRTEEPVMSGALPSDAARVGTKPTEPHVRTTEDSDSRSSLRPRTHSRVKSSSIPLTDTIREQWATLAGFKKKHQSVPNTPIRKPQTPELVTDDLPIPQAVSKHEVSAVPSPIVQDQPPPLPPAHRSTYSIGSHFEALPDPQSFPLHRGQQQQQPAYEVSSPLRDEYEHSSSASGTETDSDETDATSETSDDDYRSELKDQPMPLMPLNQGKRLSSFGASRPLPKVPTTSGSRTLDPTDSASNGPYRRAPPPSSFPAHRKKRTIAMVCSWSDRGIWEPVQDDECSIVISPGLVQAFQMSAAHSQPMNGADWEEVDDGESSYYDGQSPLVEFELTPVVPLRKGTALDITIRSPPTSNSTIRTTNNVMFRSRTVQECEKLYQLINWARCNNPTYAQLSRARAREASVSFAVNVTPAKSKSWFSFGSREKLSYRAPSRPPTSIADSAATSSSGTSAFSALKNFGVNSPFSLKRSSVIRRSDLINTADSLYSSSNGGSGSGTSTPVPPSQAGFVPGPEGPNVPATSAAAANGGGMVNNMKIRLFLRQGQKWEALGQCLLTVLPAATAIKDDSAPDMTGASTPPQRISRAPSSMPQPRAAQGFRLPSSNMTPHRIHGDGREKRVLITAAKRKEFVLLDEVLGESCFEKVMQTGIAVNVWKEDERINEYGGVMTGKSSTYMIQFRTSTEASWVFNMCGTYRYGAGTTA